MLKCNRCGRRCTTTSGSSLIHNVVLWISYKEVFDFKNSDVEDRKYRNTLFVSCLECLKAASELLNKHYNAGEK
jgi:hypothetical protein